MPGITPEPVPDCGGTPFCASWIGALAENVFSDAEGLTWESAEPSTAFANLFAANELPKNGEPVISNKLAAIEKTRGRVNIAF
jgi:hypothetical protein